MNAPLAARRWLSFSLAVGLFLAVRAGYAGEAAPAKETAAAKPAAGEKPKEPAKDPFEIPNGSFEEILRALEKIAQAQPDTQDENARKEFSAKALKAMLTAADRILAGKPTEEQAGVAAQMKVEVYATQIEQGDEEARKKLEALPAELEKSGWPKAARAVRGMILVERLSAASLAGEEQLKKVMEEVKKQISGDSLGEDDLRLAMQAIQIAEQSQSKQLAIDLNRHFAKVFGANKNEAIARFGKQLEGTARRLELPGHPMEIEGRLLDGKPFSWEPYKGKLVLVQFWATWCGPCRQEIESLLPLYAKYHDKGFEIIGISRDEDGGDLQGFVKEKKIPWPILADYQLEKDGKSMGLRYGVFVIPQAVLVDKDGKVIATGLSVSDIERQVARRLGPEKEKSEKKPEAK